jgi:hypothetical protein
MEIMGTRAISDCRLGELAVRVPADVHTSITSIG